MTVDTNILIAYLDGEDAVVSAMHELLSEGRVLFLPATVHIVLLSYSQFTDREVRELENFLFSAFVYVPIGQEVARIASMIRRTVSVRTPDATIAATALLTKTPLLTRNVRDFKNIATLDVRTL